LATLFHPASTVSKKDSLDYSLFKVATMTKDREGEILFECGNGCTCNEIAARLMYEPATCDWLDLSTVFLEVTGNFRLSFYIGKNPPNYATLLKSQHYDRDFNHDGRPTLAEATRTQILTIAENGPFSCRNAKRFPYIAYTAEHSMRRTLGPVVRFTSTAPCLSLFDQASRVSHAEGNSFELI